MSEVASTPAAPAQSAPTSAPAPQAAAAPAAPPATTEPTFIAERVERAKRAQLKELGIKVKKGEDPAAKIAEFKASKEERKAQRAAQAAKISEHEATIEKLSGAAAAVKVYSDVEFNLLAPEQQAVVTQAAGDNPDERLRVIAIMKASQAQAAKEAGKGGNAKEAPIAAPAQTSPATAAPEVASATPVNVKAEYSRLAKTNPYLAAAYLLQPQNRHEFYQQPQ